MSCFNPLPAFFYRRADGSEGFSLKAPPSRDSRGFEIFSSSLEYPCGKCIGCLKAHRQSWAMRLHHESQYHPVSTFLTLTYDERHVPFGIIPYVHFQSFMRDLRISTASRIRFFAAAEYGARTARPHFHAIIFGFYPSDAFPIQSSASGNDLFSSQSLLDIWSKGHVSFAPFTPATAGYVAGYVTKKVRLTKRSSHDVISGYDLPEYHRSSTKPGIGHQWLMDYHSDVLRDGFVIHSGNKVAIPRYYRKLLAKHWPDEYKAMSLRRSEYFSDFDPDASFDRVLVREQIALAANSATSRRVL